MAPKSALLGKETEVINLYKNGQSCRRIANTYKASELTVKRLLLKSGVVLHGQRLTDHYSDIIQSYQNGKTLWQVGNEFDVSNAVIRKILEKHDVPRRSVANLLKDNLLDNEEQILSDYLAGKTQDKICDQYKIARLTLLDLLQRAGYDQRQRGDNTRTYTVDHSYFDNIDTEHKAYFLGFLYADGYNDQKGGGVRLMLHTKDENMVLAFRDALGSNAPLFYKKGPQFACGVTINSRRLSNRLAELGCMQAKTFKLTFPEWLSPALHHHFIRGYFDGDGHISSIKKQRFDSIISILGTESFTNSLAEIINRECGVSVKTRNHQRSAGIQYANVRGNNQVKRVIAWLYNDATVFLPRKKERADAIASTDFHNTRRGVTGPCITKLTALKIKDELRTGKSDQNVADQYGTSIHIVRQIRTGRSWVNV